MKLNLLFGLIIITTQLPISGCESDNAITPEYLEFTGPGPLTLADPHIMLYDSVYYAYGTSNANGIEVYYSKNLYDWTKHNQLALNKANVYGEHSFWAPEVYYISEKGKFYMCYTSEKKVCIAESSSPLGPFTQSTRQPLLDFEAIDNTLLISRGKYYMYFSQMEGGIDIWGVEIDPHTFQPILQTLSHCCSPEQKWESKLGINEGPSVIKESNSYYLFYSANGYQNQNYSVGCAIAQTPLGPWSKIDQNPILTFPKYGNETLMGVGHGSAFKDINGNWKYVFHAHFSESKVEPRSTYICNLYFSDPQKRIPFLGENIIQPFVTSMD